MKYLRSFDYLTFFSIALLLSGCGGSGGDNVEITPSDDGFQVRLDIHAFDFVYDESDYAVVDIVANSIADNKLSLIQGHLLFGSSERSKYTYYFDELQDKTVSIALLDRNTQLPLQETQISAKKNTSFLLFAFGNMNSSSYSLYSVESPKISINAQTVPLFVIDGSARNLGSTADIYLNGDLLIEALVAQTLSQQLSLSRDHESLSIEVQRDDEVVRLCSTDFPKEWQDNAWLLIFAPDNSCHLKSIS